MDESSGTPFPRTMPCASKDALARGTSDRRAQPDRDGCFRALDIGSKHAHAMDDIRRKNQIQIANYQILCVDFAIRSATDRLKIRTRSGLRADQIGRVVRWTTAMTLPACAMPRAPLIRPINSLRFASFYAEDNTDLIVNHATMVQASSSALFIDDSGITSIASKSTRLATIGMSSPRREPL